MQEKRGFEQRLSSLERVLEEERIGLFLVFFLLSIPISLSLSRARARSHFHRLFSTAYFIFRLFRSSVCCRTFVPLSLLIELLFSSIST